MRATPVVGARHARDPGAYCPGSNPCQAVRGRCAGIGGPPGTRTPNQKIKSLLLYQLS